MTAQELYERIPEQVSMDLNDLECSIAFPEIMINYHWFPWPDDSDYNPHFANNRITIKIYKTHFFDGHRGWKLISVWYLGTPVMICQSAGRSFRDHKMRYITNVELFKVMTTYVQSLVPIDFRYLEDNVIDGNTEMPELTNFYGSDLNNF